MLELQDTEAQLYKQKFDNIAAKYEAKLDRLDNKKSIVEENITQSKYTTKSGTSNTKNYKSLIALEEKSIARLKSQKKELEASLNKAVKDGTIKKYSEEWYTMQGTIDDVALSIEQSTTTILESYENMFDGIAEKYDATINRLEGKKDIYESRNERSQYNTRVSKLSNKNYYGIIEQDQKIYEQAAKKREAQQAVLDKAIADGLKVGSEKWNNLQAEINAATLEMSQAQVNILQTYEEMFDNVADKYGSVISRYEGKTDVYESRIERSRYNTDVSKLNNDNYYKIIEQEQNIYDQLSKQRIEQQAILGEAVANGLEVGSAKWNEMRAKINETTLAMTQAQVNISQIYEEMFDQVGSKYDSILQGYDHTASMLDEYISQAEAKGHIVSGKYYEQLISNEEARIGQLEKKQSDLIAARDEAVASGKIAVGSQAWHDMGVEIDGVTQEIKQGETAILEYAKAMKEIEWEIFDLAQERMSNLNDEAEFFIDLMSNKKLHDDNGQLTDEGLATMGLHGQKYNTYMYQADDYGKEAAKLNREIEQDPYNQDLINRRNELLQLQRESILSAEDEKQAIKDLVEEGINLELDALQEKIDKQNESLQSAKDLYEYNKKVKEQTKEIANLEKQMAAYSGDDSEESKAKIQEIKVALEEARDNLQETEYDKYISDSEKLLDSLFLEYETILNSRLDNIDGLITETIASINENSGIIADTLSTSAESVGYTMSEEMNGIWTQAGTVLTTYGQGFQILQTSTNTILGQIKTSVDNIMLNSDKEAEQNITDSATQSSSQVENLPEVKVETKPETKVETKPETKVDTKVETKQPVTASNLINTGTQVGKQLDNNKTTTTPTRTTKDYYGVALAIWNGNYGWGTGDTREKRLKKKGFDVAKMKRVVNKLGDEGYVHSGAWAGKYHGIKSLTPYHYNKFAQGSKNIGRDQMAWTQEQGLEYIVRPSDGAILTPVARNDSVLNAAASGNIWDMANNPADFIRDNLKMDTSNIINGASVQTSCIQNFDKIIFNMPNVRNYDETLAQMAKDKNFERLVTSMTTDRIVGKSALAKGKAIR